MKKYTLVLLLGAMLSGPVCASELPDLGDVATSTLSPQSERQIGEEIMQQIRWREAAYLDDAELEGYLNRLGERLVRASADPSRAFTFFLVNDATLNAFAFPGGYIGVHTGLITATESESELASVMGHEIAHVTQRHIAQLVGKQNQASVVMVASLILAALAANSSSAASEAALVMGQGLALQSQLGYSRTFEREADRLGLQTLEGAGFDVRGMPAFFERLQRSSRLYEDARFSTPGYLRTHPLTQERIADVGNRVAQMRYRQVVDSEDYTFVKAKLRAAQGAAAETIRSLESQLAGGRDDTVTRYALARALLRGNRIDEAQKQVDALRGSGAASPFIDSLAAEIRIVKNDSKGAVALLEPAVERYPGYESLRYALIDALIRDHRAARAVELARSGTVRDPSDLRMWELLARAEAERGNRIAQHRAQAEVYVLRGSLSAAIEQLEMARRVEEGDFFEQSRVDARLRELKTLEQEKRKQK